MTMRRIQAYLEGNKVTFGAIHHRCAYMAEDVVGAPHVPGHCIAKTVITKVDGRLVLVVVPATEHVEMDKLQRETGAADVRLAKEEEFKELFEGCQRGTEPPFGNLFGVRTLVDWRLSCDQDIAFNAGTHSDVFLVKFVDYLRLAQPRIVDVASELAPKPTHARHTS